MLQVSHLSKRFGAQLVLDDVTFTLDPGERLGLIGPNGSGKSTLLRIIAGEEVPDGGSVVRREGLTIGYLSQTLDEIRGRRVSDAVRPPGVFTAAETEVESAAAALGRGEPGAHERYERAVDAFEAAGGYGLQAMVARVLAGLGLAAVDPETGVDTLSGGQKTRVGLARLLLSRPEVLLLDEPTNHLDIEALEWLEGFIRSFPGGVIVVSHDREFLDRTATGILALDGVTRRLRTFAGSYSEYTAEVAREREARAETWRRQEEYVDRVRSDITTLKDSALAIERSTTPRQPYVRRLARKKAALAKSRERKLERYLASDERVEKPGQSWSLKLEFGRPQHAGREAVRLQGVVAGYGAEPVLHGVNLSIVHGERVGIVGPNGAGKTTLLRVIDGRLPATEGTAWLSPNVHPGTMTQEQETLDPSWRVLDAVRRARAMDEGEARTFLHQFLFAGDDAFKLVGTCSPGERTRLQLARLVLGGCNLLVLDEPLNHLDVDAREHFEAALKAFPGAVIAVAHDRVFLRGFASRIVEVRGGGVRSFVGGYDDYERGR